MKNNKMVSVCMITYNHEKYISKAIESILMQKTSFPIKLIIGDDCSSDNTREILVQYKRKHPEMINLILHEHNIGAINNFIETIQSGNSQFIAFCEGDDYWTDPLKLQKQVDFLEANPDFSLCFHDALILWEDKSHSPKYFCSKDQKAVSTIEDVIEKWFIPSASMLFRSEYINPLPEWFKDVYNGDYALQLLLVDKGNIGYINEVMSVYRKAPGSLSFNTNMTNDFVSKSIIELLKYFNEETNYMYNDSISKRINSINRKNKEYYLKRNHPLYFHSTRPILTIGKIMRDLGKFIINKAII